MISTASGTRKTSTIIAVGLSILITQVRFGGFTERWRRTCVVKTSQGAPPGMAIHWLTYLIVPARALMREPMLVPSSWNAAIVATATRAAATAYSESSSPVSSIKNFLNMIDSFLQGFEGLSLPFQPAASCCRCLASQLNDY